MDIRFIHAEFNGLLEMIDCRIARAHAEAIGLIIDGLQHIPVLVGLAYDRLRDGQHLNPAQGSARSVVCACEQIVDFGIVGGQREG